MKPPATVKIGALEWRIIIGGPEFDGACEDNEGWLFGSTRPRHLYSAIAPGLPAGQERSTVLHELLHALLHTGGDLMHKGSWPKDTIEREEMFVRVLENLLLGLIRDNPALIKYLTAKD